ncbi:hypothetical protein AG1IA_03364 [Rhizoctonia solani AG-1 IA]|uniref:Uncharacterized protein n=1 Tax=Thanatephorus cucumeris (strain AG1-IA) TaxID=983506 RepID=L8X0H7_THACA|nr:hypothetical protein AG1IA_03364 [Rhizoctonia solani AG-1 IA]
MGTYKLLREVRSAEPVADALAALEVPVLVLDLVFARTALVESTEVLKRDTVEDADRVARAEVVVIWAEVSEATDDSVTTLVEVVDVATVDELVLLVRPLLVEEAVTLEVLCVSEADVPMLVSVVDLTTDVDRDWDGLDVNRDDRVVIDPVSVEVERTVDVVADNELAPRVFVVNRTGLEREAVVSSLTPNLVVAVSLELVTVRVTGSVGQGVEDNGSLELRDSWEVA